MWCDRGCGYKCEICEMHTMHHIIIEVWYRLKAADHWIAQCSQFHSFCIGNNGNERRELYEQKSVCTPSEYKCKSNLEKTC